MKLINKNVDKDGGGYVYQVLCTALYAFRLTHKFCDSCKRNTHFQECHPYARRIRGHVACVQPYK